MSDRVAVISAGRVEQIGAVDEIYYRPASRFVATFIGETNIVEAEVLAGTQRTSPLPHRRRAGTRREDWLCRARREYSPLPSSGEDPPLPHNPPRALNAFPGRISAEVFKGAVDDLTVVRRRRSRVAGAAGKRRTAGFRLSRGRGSLLPDPARGYQRCLLVGRRRREESFVELHGRRLGRNGLSEARPARACAARSHGRCDDGDITVAFSRER